MFELWSAINLLIFSPHDEQVLYKRVSVFLLYCSQQRECKKCFQSSWRCKYKYFMENVCNDRELESWATLFFCTNNSQEHNKRMFVQTIYMHNARFSLLTLFDVPFPSLRDSLDVYRYIHECRRWATRMREMRDAFLFTYTEIYLYRSLLRTPFSLPPPLPVERPSLLKFLVRGRRSSEYVPFCRAYTSEADSCRTFDEGDEAEMIRSSLYSHTILKSSLYLFLLQCFMQLNKVT